METQDENRLERMLRLAADEPAHRPELLRALLDSTIYVLGSTRVGGGTVDLPVGSKIDIQHWQKQDGTPAIPFFTSLEVLQKSIEIEQSYFALPAKALFEMTLGTNLVLNSKSPYGKEFVPNEIKHMLALGVAQVPTQRTYRKRRRYCWGSPGSIHRRWSIRYRSCLPSTAT